ncbi:dTDP-4-dehydrorhamnose 3,5-epimerase [Robertmurraya kyonggiensis]|uniref:dTDP-4-dehydrorhamnose 3,5-epimerase n=1 Tax=Robertmurraya kyonggiensis TaxID=1037680 RepID=A0A4U1D4N0_9BACI|nr:dTDP-4-dehydrorhamnose 3,5-epimerase [Robertmurraya kyonggiensis]
MKTLRKTKIPGVYELINNQFNDQRGSFVKKFHENDFEENGLQSDFKEQYFSVSKKGVFRGFHFQTPPEDHVKLVYCVQGEVLDIVVDLRKSSPTFGLYVTFDLSAEEGNSIYIPKGCAHGFFVKSEQAILVYNVTTVYSPIHDTGIHWSSVKVPELNSEMIISERDNHFDSLENYKSPFN